MSKIYGSVTELIGNTPLLELKNIEKKYELKAKLLAKLEYLNPSGSAKDRAALEMIEDAKEKGILPENPVFIEPTSGNTGIGIALVAAARGWKAIIVMPDNMSQERIKLMKFYGAEVVLTPAAKGMSGAVSEAERLCEATEGGIILGQFDNPANASAHFKTTGPEIIRDTDGAVDAFVAGVGTGGTLTGTGKYLKTVNPSVKIIAVEPESSPLLSKGYAGPHGIQGIGANFVPSVLDKTVIDEIIPVSDSDSVSMALEIAGSEGVFVGISSGAALKAAVLYASRPENEGKTVVVLLPDSGDRYISSLSK